MKKKIAKEVLYIFLYLVLFFSACSFRSWEGILLPIAISYPSWIILRIIFWAFKTAVAT